MGTKQSGGNNFGQGETMPQYEQKAKERIRKGLQRYIPILRDAAQRGINEEDTSTIVQAMLVDLLGYERFREISAQYKVKGHYVDWAVHVDADLKFFVEVKALGAKLHEKDLFQVTGYARQKPTLDWAILTTGDVWQCHRVAAGSETEQFFEVRLFDPEQPSSQQLEWLYLLSREAVSRNLMQRQWEQEECYRPMRLASVLLSADGLNAIRRIVKRQNPRRRVEATDLRDALVRGVIRGDVYATVAKLASESSAGQRKDSASAPKQTQAASRTRNMFATLINERKLLLGEEIYDAEGQTIIGRVRDAFIERAGDGQTAVNMRQLTGSSSFAAAAVKREGALIRFDRLRRP